MKLSDNAEKKFSGSYPKLQLSVLLNLIKDKIVFPMHGGLWGPNIDT